MELEQIERELETGQTALGIELGSTRIKAVLIGTDHRPVAAGSHDWENENLDGVWTYSLDSVWAGVQAAYRDLAGQVRQRYGLELKKIGVIGISAMMHGYLPFDGEGRLLVPFRTWRNTMTAEAAAELTGLFDFNIPQRWSVAHFYQAVLNREPHVGQVAFLTTLAGYVHWRLTGEKVLGVGDASGMFPVDSAAGTYDQGMLEQFDGLLKAHEVPVRLGGLLPRVLPAGEPVGTLTPEGALLLDPTGALEPGIPLCPPEGDAGTGMAATNSVAPRTGNVSAGTSIFAMAVLERPLQKVHPEIDLVTTPTGRPVAMVHCNTCTSDLDAWVRLFDELLRAVGSGLSKSELYALLYCKALEGDADCGGLTVYNYYSGEPVTGLADGRPLLVRRPDAALTLGNLMRAHLYSAVATLKIGMDLLFREEHVVLDRLQGHGGLFKVKGVAQRFLSSALDVPVSVLSTAGEGGPWGMALLAAYALRRAEGESLEEYLEGRVFRDARADLAQPEAPICTGFEAFMARYRSGLAVERAAVAQL